MGLFNSRLAVVGCVLLSVWTFPALGQTTVEVPARNIARTMTLPAQEFHCHTGYPLAECEKDILHLKAVLARYPIGSLGHWTWVLVRSLDWEPISRKLGLNPVSPAFTALEARETFIEAGLFAHDPERTSELMTEWSRSMPQLLELAVSHELGHALCAEPNEAVVDHFAQELRHGLIPPCRVTNKEARKRTLAAGERHGLTLLP